MLIVIEGPDRVGKSTLARAINDEIERRGRRSMLLHRGAPAPNDIALLDYALPISTYAPGGSDFDERSMVCDRLHVGDLTYGPIYRGETRQTKAMVEYTDALIVARGGLRVYVTADCELIKLRIRAEGEDNSYLKIKDVEAIVNKYEQVCGAAGWKRVTTTNWVLARGEHVDAARLLVTMAQELERTARMIYTASQDYIGPARPAALMIMSDSDDTGANAAAALYSHLPHIGIMTPWNDSVGESFINYVMDAGFLLSRDIGVVTPTNETDIRGLRRALGAPSIICFDDIAKMFLTNSRITPDAVIDHPWVARYATTAYQLAWVNRLRESVPTKQHT